MEGCSLAIKTVYLTVTSTQFIYVYIYIFKDILHYRTLYFYCTIVRLSHISVGDQWSVVSQLSDEKNFAVMPKINYIGYVSP